MGWITRWWKENKRKKTLGLSHSALKCKQQRTPSHQTGTAEQNRDSIIENQCGRWASATWPHSLKLNQKNRGKTTQNQTRHTGLPVLGKFTHSLNGALDTHASQVSKRPSKLPIHWKSIWQGNHTHKEQLSMSLSCSQEQLQIFAKLVLIFVTLSLSSNGSLSLRLLLLLLFIFLHGDNDAFDRSISTERKEKKAS